MAIYMFLRFVTRKMLWYLKGCRNINIVYVVHHQVKLSGQFNYDIVQVHGAKTLYECPGRHFSKRMSDLKGRKSLQKL